MHIENLRSPTVKTNGLFYFARMLDKIRLHLAGKLPAEYLPNLGGGFDANCVSFLWIEYPALVARATIGGSDEEILEWAFTEGRKPAGDEIEIWNAYLSKRGWRDAGTERLAMRKRDAGFSERSDIQTFFDFIDADEGRAPQASF